MVRAAISFFILAIVAYVFGAYGIAGVSIDIGKALLIVFMSLAVISYVVFLANGKKNMPLP